MDKFDQEATSLSARDSLYELDSAKLLPDSLFIGDKILIFAYPDNYNVFENFWWVEWMKTDTCRFDNLYGSILSRMDQ